MLIKAHCPILAYMEQLEIAPRATIYEKYIDLDIASHGMQRAVGLPPALRLCPKGVWQATVREC
eukprot:gene7489-55521_t